jgi:hypothetical protein
MPGEDLPGSWEEAMRDLDAQGPHRKLFEGESELSAHAAEEPRQAARERFLARFRQAMPFGGPPYPKREELYDRFDRRDEDPLVM